MIGTLMLLCNTFSDSELGIGEAFTMAITPIVESIGLFGAFCGAGYHSNRGHKSFGPLSGIGFDDDGDRTRLWNTRRFAIRLCGFAGTPLQVCDTDSSYFTWRSYALRRDGGRVVNKKTIVSFAYRIIYTHRIWNR